MSTVDNNTNPAVGEKRSREGKDEPESSGSNKHQKVEGDAPVPIRGIPLPRALDWTKLRFKPKTKSKSGQGATVFGNYDGAPLRVEFRDMRTKFPLMRFDKDNKTKFALTCSWTGPGPDRDAMLRFDQHMVEEGFKHSVEWWGNQRTKAGLEEAYAGRTVNMTGEDPDSYGFFKFKVLFHTSKPQAKMLPPKPDLDADGKQKVDVNGTALLLPAEQEKNEKGDLVFTEPKIRPALSILDQYGDSAYEWRTKDKDNAKFEQFIDTEFVNPLDYVKSREVWDVVADFQGVSFSGTSYFSTWNVVKIIKREENNADQYMFSRPPAKRPEEEEKAPSS